MAVYEGLFERTGGHRYLHQMAFVERERGRYEAALALIKKEKVAICAEYDFKLAVNAYEQAHDWSFTKQIR